MTQTRIHKGLIGLLILFSAVLFKPTPAHSISDAIIAVVNDEIVTLKDLRDYIRSTYVSLVAEGKSQDEIKALMLDLEVNGINKLIEDKLMLSRANDVGIEVRDQAIDERIKEIKGNFKSEQEFTNAMIENGATITDVRQNIADRMKIRYLITHEVRSKIHVNPQEITRFYEENPDEFQNKERVNLESIFIANGEDPEASESRALEAFQLIESGRDFLEVAKEYSDAPSVGVVERGQMLPVIEDVVFRLQPGEFTRPIKIENGYFLFQLIGRVPTQRAALREVKDRIKEHIFQQKFGERFTDWLSELKKDAYIEIKK